MFSVEDILSIKGKDVFTISPSAPMQEALKIMSDNNLGAVVVLQNETVIGIFSERDLARKIIGKDACSLQTKVRDLMTSSVTVVEPRTSVEDCMTLMTDKHIRHLPVVQSGKLIGIISIGDVVKAILSSREHEIDKLQEYITGTDYGH